MCDEGITEAEVIVDMGAAPAARNDRAEGDVVIIVAEDMVRGE